MYLTSIYTASIFEQSDYTRAESRRERYADTPPRQTAHEQTSTKPEPPREADGTVNEGRERLETYAYGYVPKPPEYVLVGDYEARRNCGKNRHRECKRSHITCSFY